MKYPTDKSKVIVHNDGTVTFFRKIQGFPNGGVWQRSTQETFRGLETCSWTELRRVVHKGRLQGASSSFDETAHHSKSNEHKCAKRSAGVKGLSYGYKSVKVADKKYHVYGPHKRGSEAQAPTVVYLPGAKGC